MITVIVSNYHHHHHINDHITIKIMTNVMTNESLQKDQVGLVLEEIERKTADVVLVQQTEM